MKQWVCWLLRHSADTLRIKSLHAPELLIHPPVHSILSQTQTWSKSPISTLQNFRSLDKKHSNQRHSGAFILVCILYINIIYVCLKLKNGNQNDGWKGQWFLCSSPRTIPQLSHHKAQVFFFNVHVNHMSTIAHEFLSQKWTFKSPCWNCPLILTRAVSPEHYPKIHLKNPFKFQNVLPKSSNIHENLMKVPKTSTKIPIWTAVAEAGVVEKGPWTLPHLGRLLYLIALELGWWHCISEDTQADIGRWGRWDPWMAGFSDFCLPMDEFSK